MTNTQGSTLLGRRFSGKRVLVTGGAGGLGSAIVRAFAAESAHVVVADTDIEKAKALARDLGESAHALSLDVSNEADWVAALARVESEFGGLDVLVNNAGFFAPNIAFEDMDLALWRKHFSINCDGVFLGCKHGIRSMKKRGGAIVNLGSGMSITPNPTASAYCASKAAVLMTTRTAAAAAGRYGIRVNAVLPGAVDTPMLAKNLRDGDNMSQYLQQLASFSALNRLATPADIARAVLFLADPANDAVTGIHVPVDGGNLLGR
jgi:NAD(P)-dependent dehydrogenase (short-subunit alcohol dehydrogenase family)